MGRCIFGLCGGVTFRNVMHTVQPGQGGSRICEVPQLPVAFVEVCHIPWDTIQVDEPRCTGSGIQQWLDGLPCLRRELMREVQVAIHHRQVFHMGKLPGYHRELLQIVRMTAKQLLLDGKTLSHRLPGTRKIVQAGHGRVGLDLSYAHVSHSDLASQVLVFFDVFSGHSLQVLKPVL